jgi:hypothetical protein
MPSLAAQSPRFEDYEISVYTGTIHRPNWIRRASADEWRDKLGKRVEPAEVNFAGKYFVSVHSCGTGCRYYTMTDLSSGREMNLLNGFGAAEPPPKTREGYPYVTDLVTRANSKLLVAQYRIDAPRGEECRERAFVFEGDKLSPITGTRRAYAILTRASQKGAQSLGADSPLVVFIRTEKSRVTNSCMLRALSLAQLRQNPPIKTKLFTSSPRTSMGKVFAAKHE